MQNAFTSFALLSALLLIVAAVITALALRNAPEGHEDGDGFHFGHESAVPAIAQDTWNQNGGGGSAAVDAPHAAWAANSRPAAHSAFAA